jgi:hypothetical protein
VRTTWKFRIRPQKTLLFVIPDYHCSYIYREELRKLGWKVDIYVPWSYPDHLLFSPDDVVRPPRISRRETNLYRILNSFLADLWFLTRAWKYRFHLYYGRPPVWFTGWTRIFPNRASELALKLSKALAIKLIYLPTGCHDELSKAEFSELDSGQVCGNCGAWDRCLEELNLANFRRIRQYFDMAITAGATPTNQYVATPVRWKAIDLDAWSPNLVIPNKHMLPRIQGLRIMHSFSSNGRDFLGRNIKGSAFVKQAVERLQDEGHEVEFLFLKDIPSRDMRFYQSQADIIVDQLRYGWWGSTGVETMSLGKPVICYLRPQWKLFFFRCFPEHQELPIIEASVDSIYSVLRKLVVDYELRQEYGRRSRKFAEQHFNPQVNARDLSDKLLEL